MSGTNSGKLVLVTGATGHIGFRTLIEVLRAGYRARVATRSLSTADKIKHAESIQPYLASIDYVEVPDITAPGAFDSAVQGVDYILHLASPIPITNGNGAADSDDSKTVQEVFIDPAVNGTLSILNSALKSPTIKRVVITSSVVILAPDSTNPSAPITPDSLAPVPTDPSTVAPDPWAAYRASKILSHAAAVNWTAEHSPAFSILYILPAYVQGRNELVTSSSSVGNGSNDLITALLVGKRLNQPPRAGAVVHVSDVARLEVAALTTTAARSGDRLIAAVPTGITWNDIPVLGRKLFPAAVSAGILATAEQSRAAGGLESIPIHYDVQKSEYVLGSGAVRQGVDGVAAFKFQGLESMVESLGGQYVELVEKEREREREEKETR